MSNTPHWMIDVHESCVDYGRSIDFDPRPFEGVKKKPLAPGNSAFQLEMPDEVPHMPPVRCEPCRIAHTNKWGRRKRQVPWLITVAVLLLGLSLWLLLKRRFPIGTQSLFNKLLPLLSGLLL